MSPKSYEYVSPRGVGLAGELVHLRERARAHSMEVTSGYYEEATELANVSDDRVSIAFEVSLSLCRSVALALSRSHALSSPRVRVRARVVAGRALWALWALCPRVRV